MKKFSTKNKILISYAFRKHVKHCLWSEQTKNLIIIIKLSKMLLKYYRIGQYIVYIV